LADEPKLDIGSTFAMRNIAVDALDVGDGPDRRMRWSIRFWARTNPKRSRQN
jgi:hypothetical protein